MIQPRFAARLAALAAALALHAHAAEDIAWSYGGETGPGVWGSLHPSFAACAAGTEQSPVDLDTDIAAGDTEWLVAAHRPGAATVENNGHTFVAHMEAAGGIALGAGRYQLAGLHFHHGSEHTVSGQRLPLEMHLVHRDAQGALAVLGVLFAEGAHNAALDPLWKHLAASAKEPVALPGRFDVRTLLPADRAAWQYRGSLTTPPCSEGVSWVVFSTPLTISRQQIAAFAALFPNNYRPTQPLGRRVVRFGANRGMPE